MVSRVLKLLLRFFLPTMIIIFCVCIILFKVLLKCTIFRQAYKSLYPCYESFWLGVIYNKTVKNYTWLDSAPITIQFLPSTNIPSNDTFIANTPFSDWRMDSEGFTLCQKRLCKLTFTCE